MRKYSKIDWLVKRDLSDDLFNNENFDFILNNQNNELYGEYYLNDLEENSLTKSYLKKALNFLSKRFYNIQIAYSYRSERISSSNNFFPDSIRFISREIQSEFYLVRIYGEIGLFHLYKNPFTKVEELKEKNNKKIIEKVRTAFNQIIEIIKNEIKEEKDELELKKNLIEKKLEKFKVLEIYKKLGYLKTIEDVDSFKKEFFEELLQEEIGYIKRLSFKSISRYIYDILSNSNIKFSPGSKRCYRCDLEYIDSKEDYLDFLYKICDMANGELNIENTKVFLNEDNYEVLEFYVNGVFKQWRLEKERQIYGEFFIDVVDLSKEFNANGRYVATLGGQDYILDYFTPEEFHQFTELTKIKMDWF